MQVRQLFKNIATLTPVFMEQQSGVVSISSGDEDISVNVFEGEIVNDKNKELFMKLIQLIHTAEITFVPQLTARTYQVFSLVSLLWKIDQTIINISAVCQEHLYDKILKKGPKSVFYKLENLTNDDFLVYLFFIKSEVRTLKDLISFYPNKEKSKLEIAAYRLFLVGELVLGEEIALKDTTKVSTDMVKTALLQKLLNKVASLSYNNSSNSNARKL